VVFIKAKPTPNSKLEKPFCTPPMFKYAKILWSLSMFTSVSKCSQRYPTKPLEIARSVFLQARCPFKFPTTSDKAQKATVTEKKNKKGESYLIFKPITN